MAALASDTVALFGMPISNVTMAQAVARIEEFILSGGTHQIATANLDFARNSLRDPYLHRIICECSMVLPDGAPMLWASAIMGAPLVQRVTGVDLVPELARLSQTKGYGVYFLGSSEESSLAASQVLSARFPGVRIVGRHSPAISPLHKLDNEDILRRIHFAKPNIIMVAFGNPKQEIWIHRYKDQLPPSVVIGIGGSLDMIGGRLRRAPRWIQVLQIEWAFRMLQEPSRLMPRYLRDAGALLSHLPLGVVANRLQPFERRQRGSAVVQRTGIRVFAAPGKIAGRVASILLDEAKAAAQAGDSLVVDLSSTLRIEAEGIGGLLHARRVMLDAGLWIWLTGMSNPVRRVLQFSAVADLFRVAKTPAAAIQFTRAAQAGLRTAMDEVAGTAACPSAAYVDVESVAACASEFQE